LWGFISGFVLNAVLAAQMVYYWNAPAAGNKVEAGRSNPGLGGGVSSGVSPDVKNASLERRRV